MMKKYLLVLLCLFVPVATFAAEHAPLQSMDVDLTNKASLQRGMRLFVNRCMGCHSAKFERFERAAEDLDIPKDLVEKYLIFDPNTRISGHMLSAMPAPDAKVWFGNAPPDLTLETRYRGVDWVYTYLLSFYNDPSRPWGVNNAVFPDVGMPDVLADMQGEVVNHCDAAQAHENQGKLDPLTGDKIGNCRSVVPGTGTMSPEEFDKSIYDLVNFMSYISEPSKMVSGKIGTNVLIFLVIFFIVAYALKKEYWKDVH